MTAAHDRNRSTRMIVRQVSELLLARWSRWQVVIPDHRLNYVVFQTVLSASIAHQPLRDPASGALLGIATARDRARPVNASAIALPMALALTSVRRCADKLVDAGLLVRQPAGYVVAERVFADDTLADVVAHDAVDIARVLRALGATGYAPAAEAVARGVGDVPPDVVSRLLLAFALRSLETIAALYGDFPSGAIVTAIIAANIRKVTEDDALTRRYAAEESVPPDAVRQPIAVRELARSLAMPFETVRRRVAALVAAGVVAGKGDGVIVPTAVLLGQRQIENNRRIAQNFEQMIASLVALAGGPRG